MPTLTIKKVPPALYEKIKESARRHRRSMNSEVITLLEHVLLPTPRDAERLIAEAEELNRKVSIRFSEDLIEKGKREGRA